MTLTWTKLNPATLWSVRARHVVEYDRLRDEILVFGGNDGWNNGGAPNNETWIGALPGSPFNWVQKTPAHSPSARFGAAHLWDPYNNRILIFGGHTGGALLNDLWSWDGVDWTQLSPGGGIPAQRAFSIFAVHPTGGYALMVGGGDGFTAATPFKTLKLQLQGGYSWSEIATAHAPTPCHYPAFEYYPPTGECLLCFGGNWWNTTDQLWAFDGVDWTNIISGSTWDTAKPGGAYDWCWNSVHQRMYFLGCIDTVGNGTWVYLFDRGARSFRRQATLPLQPGEGGVGWDPPPLARRPARISFFRPQNRSIYLVGGLRYVDTHNDTQLLTNDEVVHFSGGGVAEVFAPKVTT